MTTAILVATFKDYSSAKQAARELEELGISREDINVHSDLKIAAAGSVEQETEGESRSGFIGWWRSLFGSEEHAEHRRGYEDQLSSGRAIVRAAVADDMVDSAVSVLNRKGATAIEHEESSEETQPEGWRRAEPRGGVRVYNQNSAVVRTGTPATGLSPTKPSPGVQSGFGTTPGSGTLAGETTTGLRDQDFTPEYQQNFEKMYRTESGPEFDSMQPAYEFGHRFRLDEAYGNRSWDEIENDVRTRWEQDNPSMEWGRAKDAIRYGWDTAGKRAQ